MLDGIHQNRLLCEMNNPPAAPPDARSFSFPKSLRLLMIVGFLFFIGMTVFGFITLLDPNEPDRQIAAIAITFFAAFAIFILFLIRQLSNSIIVSEEGLTFVARKKPRVFLKWEEIAEIRPQDGFRQRFDVIDKNGVRRMKISYALTDFEELHHLLSKRIPIGLNEYREKELSILEVGRSLRNMSLIAGIAFWGFAIFTFVFASGFDRWAALAFFVMGVPLFALAFLFEAYELEIRDDRLVLRSRIRERTILFKDLIDVNFQYKEVQYGSNAALVELKLIAGKPIRFGDITVGAAVAHRAIRGKWEKWLLENRG